MNRATRTEPSFGAVPDDRPEVKLACAYPTFTTIGGDYGRGRLLSIDDILNTGEVERIRTSTKWRLRWQPVKPSLLAYFGWPLLLGFIGMAIAPVLLGFVGLAIGVLIAINRPVFHLATVHFKDGSRMKVAGTRKEQEALLGV